MAEKVKKLSCLFAVNLSIVAKLFCFLASNYFDISKMVKFLQSVLFVEVHDTVLFFQNYFSLSACPAC